MLRRHTQAAGLGCSDSLRLLGMTNVTVMNSVLFDEAACHTPTGTAAVILGRISQVKFVNNIIFGVPATGSPDETGIDFEWSEDHVTLQANFFAANAGPAVEILNIHGGDHSSDLEFEGNTFAQNAHSRQPGAASVWEDNKGRGYASPAGKIRNNLYFEPARKILRRQKHRLDRRCEQPADDDWRPITQPKQFSATQGKNQWRYMYETPGTTWTEMPYYSASDNNGAWETSHGAVCERVQHGAGKLHRQLRWERSRPGVGCDSLRESSASGGTCCESDGQGGAGMTVAVNLVSGRNVTQIWPSQGGKQLIAGTDQAGICDGCGQRSGCRWRCDPIRGPRRAAEASNDVGELDAIGWVRDAQDLDNTSSVSEYNLSLTTAAAPHSSGTH